MHLPALPLHIFFLYAVLPLLFYIGAAQPDTAPVTKRDPAPLAFDSQKAIPFPFPDYQAPVLENILWKIESIPDEVFKKGKEAVAVWLENTDAENGKLAPRVERQGFDSAVAVVDWAAVVKCSLEILRSVIESGFPLETLLRFRELITDLGGARTVARMLLQAKSLQEFAIIGGPLLSELGETLMSLKGVAGACFSWA